MKTPLMKDDPAHNWKAADGGKRALGKHAGFQERETMTDDFGHEVAEARVLPIGGGGNIICGLEGYQREIANRRHMNRTLDASAKWDLPTWESLRVYFPEPV